MGGIMARAGGDNDELIDVLIEENYIKTPAIEKVFRAVDRAEYFLPQARSNAYNGLAWKSCKLHLSAPCVYSTAMEGLCLEPGLSFLNLGSGTGYLSTMAGLILGSNGINHGIEFYGEVVDYANSRLEDFRRYSGAIDEFDYCEPKFKQGNVLCLSSDFNGQYDRVYCGAAVPDVYETYMKNLLKVGGILVMPVDDKLLQVKRTSSTHWEVDSLLPVSFATLIQPLETCNDMVQMFEVEPTSLQALCRTQIRHILRKNIEIEHPKVKKSQRVPTIKKKRTTRRLVVPLFDSEDSSEDERHLMLQLGRNRDGPRAFLREDESDGLINLVLGTFGDGRGNSHQENNRAGHSASDDSNKMEVDDESKTGERDKSSESLEIETQAVIEHNPHSSTGTSKNDKNSAANRENPSTISDDLPPLIEGKFFNTDDEPLEQLESYNHNVVVDVFNVLGHNQADGDSNDEHESDDRMSNSTKKEKKERKKCENTSVHENNVDEIIENQSDSSDDEQGDSLSSSDEGPRETRNKRGPKKNNKPAKVLKWARVESPGAKRDTSSDNDDDDEMRMYKSPYTEFMAIKIEQLPLPPILKKYLNFYRAF